MMEPEKRCSLGVAMTDRKIDAWIETLHSAEDQRTVWRVIVDGEIVGDGEIEGDVTGAQAFDMAQTWARENHFALAGWKHAMDRNADLQVSRPRTKSEDRSPLKLYGWLHCGNGGREAVVVTPNQLRDIEAGTIPCPVCAEECGAMLEPSLEMKDTALLWNGTRWHSH